MRKAILCCALLLGALLVGAADRIAVAEPDQIAGFTPETIAGITGIIESRLAGGYEVVSRSALAAMMREGEFQEYSGMVPPKEQLAQLRQVHGVNDILAYNITRIGQKYQVTMMVIDCATGEIDPERRVNFEVGGVEDLVLRIDNALDKMGLLQPDGEAFVKELVILPVVASDAALGAKYGDRLGAYLMKTGSFELLTRDKLGQILEESAMVSHKLADFGQYAKIGRLAVADYLVEVTIPRFEHTVKTSGAAAIAGSSNREFMTLEAQVRLYDIKTGKVVATEESIVRLREQDIPSAVRRDWVEADFVDELVSRSIDAVGRLLMERIDPVLVAMVDGGSVYLTRGTGGGVESGQVYQVFNPGKTVIHPKTKQVLGVAEKYAGEVRVTSSVPNMAVAEIIDGGDIIVDGAVCRFKPAGEPAPAPANYPQAGR